MALRARLLGALAAGLLAFAVGAGLALAFLPEWRTGGLPDPGPFRARFQEIVRQAGFRPGHGEPSLRLVTDNPSLLTVYRVLGEEAAAWLTGTRSGVLISMTQTVHRPGEEREGELGVRFSLDGRPFEIHWETAALSPFGPIDRNQYEPLAEIFERQVLAPGESFGPKREGRFMGTQSWRVWDVTGSSPPGQIQTLIVPPNSVLAERRPKPSGGGEETPTNSASQLFLGLLAFTPWALAAAVIFLFLLLKSRIDMVNGAVLALLALVSVHPRWLEDLQHPVWVVVVVLIVGVTGRALWIFLVWSAGESLLRATRPDFTTSLDSLLRGRLGPRGGRALLLGCALGGGLAGARLALYALAETLPGLSPAGASIALPVFRTSGSPVLDGLWLAAGVTLATAVASRFLPDRWVLPFAALLAGFGLSPLKLFPFPAELAANVAFASVLVWVCRRLGLTSLIVAAVVSFLLPAALYSGRHADWLPGSFGLTAGLTVGIALLGVLGLARPEEVEAGVLPPPAFMRRLAHERRLQHEVDLLARMQLGLLPQEMPRVEGYEIAARSVLASEAGGDLYDFLRDEAGRLWIAAGDVAGHGYSCAVAQAMVKAGLLSLIAPEESPAGVLRQLDRVLRGVNIEHSFTSLALVRLDPVQGEASFANAGHPYPLVFNGGRVSEIDLPGLPLGQGPARPYEDRAFALPRGGVLVLCSDGLFEALDRNGNAYGFDRAREVLQAMGHRPAIEIVDALLNDCRRHLGAEQPPDDVTVVVVKRG
ncbi:MAG TPA: PP2C family protein-serine/threonine phosphatase [Thermoanaerobaculia bacterium]|jgi:sigma-B regulation protein RsbU (phosphoserine phosphatase)|nr:PP2C family protein-serine/threonine phosphatase [Thermoanaerobaculia bacterium]